MTEKAFWKKPEPVSCLAAAKGKHIGRSKGLNYESFSKVEKAIERGMSVNETVSLTGISLSSVKRYRKQIESLTEIKG